MKRIYGTAILGLALSSSCVGYAQSGTPQPVHPATKRSQGFLDYALGKINHSNRDYGSAVAEARGDVVAYTIQSLYFWSNVVSLTLLAATSTSLVLVLRTQDKREIIAATLIAQLWNGRFVDRKEIVRRTAMYNALVEAKNAALTITPPSPPIEEHAVATETPVSAAKPSAKSGVQRKAGVSDSPSSQGETGSPDVREPGQDGVPLKTQVQALRDSERNLRTRLNQVTQDLERERQRNQALKGA